MAGECFFNVFEGLYERRHDRHSPAVQAYLSTRFGLKSGDRPHLMKF